MVPRQDKPQASLDSISPGAEYVGRPWPKQSKLAAGPLITADALQGNSRMTSSLQGELTLLITAITGGGGGVWGGGGGVYCRVN